MTDFTPRLAGILWGLPKSGKTVLAASSPGKIWDINLDPEGYLSIAPKLVKGTAELWDYSDKTPSELVSIMSKNGIAKRIEDSDIDEGDTVIFDSVTQMNQAGLLVAVEKGVGSGNKSGFTPTIEEPGQTAYGARTQYVIATMSGILRATRKKKAHVWFICHEGTPEKDKNGAIMYYAPALSDNAINQASGSVSEIWRMTENDNSRTVQVRSSSLYRPCGTRMFRTDESREFKLKYDPDLSDLDQPMSLASLWQAYLSGGMQKLHIPEDKKAR